MASGAASVVELIASLVDAGVRLTLQNGELRLRAPKGVITAGVLAALRERKLEVIAALEQQPAYPVALPRGWRPESLPLSQSQENWLRQDPEGHCTPSFALILRGPVVVGALKRALLLLMERHEILRTRYVTSATRNEQVVEDSLPLPCTEVDLTGVGEDEQRAALEAVAAREIAVPIPLATGPPWRVLLCRVSKQELRILIRAHHSAADAFSMRILGRELRSLYLECVCGLGAALPDTLPYADFALWERRHYTDRCLAQHMEFWREQTAQAVPLVLASDVTRTLPGYQEGMHCGEIGQRLSDRMTLYCVNTGVTRLALLFGALQIVLSRWSGESDVTVGCLTFGRTLPQTLGTVGCFIRLLPIRTSILPSDTLAKVIQAVHGQLLQAYTFQGRTDLADVRGRNLLQLFANYLPLEEAAGRGDPQPLWPRETPWVLPRKPETLWYEMQFVYEERDWGVEMRCSYAADLYRAATIAALIQAQVAVVEAVLEGHEAQVLSVPGDPRRQCAEAR
jgi:hypothetical protein